MFDERSRRIMVEVANSDPTATQVEKDEFVRMIDSGDMRRKSYKVAEVAKMISKSSATVYNLIESGRLTAIRAGKSKRVSSVTGESVEKYLKGLQ